MPATYVPTLSSPPFHPAFTFPVNGDALTAASVNSTALEYLADNSASNRALATGTSVAVSSLSARVASNSAQASFTQARVFGASDAEITAAIPIWPIGSVPTLPLVYGTPTLGGAVGFAAWTLTWVTNSLEQIQIPINNIPAAGRIRTLGVVLEGAAGHGALPQFMPNIDLIRGSFNFSTLALTSTIVISATDASASVAVYEVAHNLSIVTDVTIDPLSVYGLVIRNEGGTNSLAGMKCHLAYVGYSR